MTLGYYMDVHIPAAITIELRRRGIDVLTSQDDGTQTQPDEFLLQRATELDRLFFSQDQDILRIANDWQKSGRPFVGAIFARQGIGIGSCVQDLDLIARCCSAEELASQVQFLPFG